jgi:alanyl-tRNA synthetase
MTAKQLRTKYLEFFEAKGHRVIPSASLLPENDPSVLFTTAGMHPLVPFLMGEKHPQGRRLVNVQKCVRVQDIDEVGDTCHHTFFEMLGNWSLGDYFKKDAISWSYEFLTDKKWLGLDPERIYVTCFSGDADAPRDEESAKIWQAVGIPARRIFFLPKAENWWGLAGGGPCGPDTEIYYDIDPARAKCSSACAPGCNCGKYLEIWNNVFMEYKKVSTGTEVMLVRHAQTDWNIDNRIQSDLEIGLNSAGIEQSKKFGRLVKEFKPDIILSSPLLRAQQTAKIIAPAADIIAEPLAVERDLGELKGLTQAQVLEKCPSDSFLKKNGVYYCLQPPGGENIEQLRERVGQLLQKIKRDYRGKKVLVVTHGEVLDMAVACQQGLETAVAVGSHGNNMAQEKFELYDYEVLQQKNVDTGMGLERTVAVINGRSDDYQTELFQPLISALENLSEKHYGANKKDDFSFRVIADHIRAAVFILGDDQGVSPSNLDQGYILRRLIRRAVRFAKKIGIEQEFPLSKSLANVVIKQYGNTYPELIKNQTRITSEIQAEEDKFEKTLGQGLKQFQKVRSQGITGKEAFDLFQTYGFPLEMTEELAAEAGVKVDRKQFDEEFAKHQQLSRRGADKKFKGGLGDRSQETTRLHTATHLLHTALRQILGAGVWQKGSNITPDRLRFDFSYPEKLTAEQKKKIEDLVNEQIAKDLPIEKKVMSVAAAKAAGAIGVFASKYGDQVNVYSVKGFSKEICGGPHAARTGELGHFRIKKEQSCGAGIRRIKAILE